MTPQLRPSVSNDACKISRAKNKKKPATDPHERREAAGSQKITWAELRGCQGVGGFRLQTNRLEFWREIW